MKWRVFWYTTKEVVPLVVILFLILTTLVFAQQLGKYSNLILSFQSSPKVTQTLLLSLIPGIVVITLPVALLLGTVVGCSRLSSDNELTALQSLGVGQLTLARPFLVLGVIGTVITCYLSAAIAPASLRTLKTLRAQILLQEANTQIKPHTFITRFPNLLLFVQKIDPKTNEWLGVFLLKTDPADGSSRLLTAKRGLFRVESSQSLTLEAQLFEGVSLQYDGIGSKPQDLNLEPAPPSTQSTAVFDKSTVKLSDDQTGLNSEKEPVALPEMTLKEVTRVARDAKTEKERRQAVAERHKRFTFPFACLTLTAMTFILAIQGRRFSTRPRTVMAILFLAMGFYLLLIVGQNLAISGVVPGWLGAWFSNLLYGAIILKYFISNRLPWSGLSAFLEGRAAPAGDGAPAGAADGSKRERAEGRSSGGAPVTSLNLINYLLLSEIAKYFALSIAALVVTIMVFTLFDLIPSIIKSGTSLSFAGSYLAYLAPQQMYYVAPFSLLVALLMGFSVLSRSNQLVIVASAGQSRIRIITAVLVSAATLSVFLWAISNYLLPYTNREQDARYNIIKGRQVEQTTIAFGRKWVYGRDNTIYSYQRIEPDNVLINTSIYRLDSAKGLIESATHIAQTGPVPKAPDVAPVTWRIEKGWEETINQGSNIERKIIPAKDKSVTIADGVSLFRRTTGESSKMSAWELQRYISQLRSLGISTLDLQIDLKRRVAFPFSCLVLAVLSIPFISARQARRAGPLVSVSLSVGIGLVFWLLTTLFAEIGKQNNLPVGMAVWGPHILFAAVGLYLNFVRYRLQ